MKKKLLYSLLVIFVFIGIRYFKYLFAYVVYSPAEWNAMDIDLRMSMINYLQIIIVFAVTAIIFRDWPFNYLGLRGEILKPMLLALMFCLPMIIGYALKYELMTESALKGIHRNMILAGFSEELIYRGFVFGLLFYYFGWGFISAALIPSVFFGLGHLYQAGNAAESVVIFLTTFLANIGFAWFYVSWNSLWIVIFLHGFMDLTWQAFTVNANVAGDGYTNIFRAMTIIFAIVFTIIKNKGKGTLSIKHKLWLNRNSYVQPN